MHLYTLGYNEKGIPELNEFAAHDTDEENGVEISFAFVWNCRSTLFFVMFGTKMFVPFAKIIGLQLVGQILTTHIQSCL